MKKKGEEDEEIPESLYDLESDIGETRNVIEDHPDVAKRLRDLAEKMRDDLGFSVRGERCGAWCLRNTSGYLCRLGLGRCRHEGYQENYNCENVDFGVQTTGGTH